METETTGTISLSPETEKFHLLGQHDQAEHAWNRGQGKTSGVDSGPDAKKETSQSRLVVKETENRSNRLRNVALGLAAIGVAAGLIYVAKKQGISKIGKKTTQEIPGDLNEMANKSTKWSKQTGIGLNAPKSTRKFSKVTEVDSTTEWKYDDDGTPFKRRFQIEAADGQKLDLYDMDGTIPEKVHEEMLNSLAVMHEMYPLKKPAKIFVLNKDILKNTPGLEDFTDADGLTLIDKSDGRIFVNASKITKDGHFPLDIANLMPSSSFAPKNHYVITHEYGHKFDVAHGYKSAGGEKGLWADMDVRDSLSDYGNSLPQEGYAEAFAEWHTTEGKTTNLAAKAYARNEGWFGGEKAFSTVAEQVSNTDNRIVRTPEGAKLFGVPIGQVIPEATE